MPVPPKPVQHAPTLKCVRRREHVTIALDPPIGPHGCNLLPGPLNRMLVSNLRRATDFGIMTLDVEAGLGPAAVNERAFTRVLDGIRSKPIDQSPFPHIYIEEIFPPDYYRALLQRIAAVGRFVPTLYPGVGVDLSAKTFRDYGLTCENFAADDELAPLHAFLKSNRFARTLLEKFSASNSWSGHGSAIPAEKHAHFADGRDDFACVFDLHKDLPGYEITPHADVTSKIITFLFYFTLDESINKFGTLLCRVRPGSSVEPAPVRRSSAVVDGAARKSRFGRRLLRSDPKRPLAFVGQI